MTICILHFGDTIKGFDTWDDLGAWLDSVNPLGVADPMLDLKHESGNILTVGLADDVGSLDFSEESYYAPYFVSVGDATLPLEGDSRAFMLPDGIQTEIPLRNCVPRAILIAAVKEFFETGSRPASLDWEEV
jgi:hypothetical protein